MLIPGAPPGAAGWARRQRVYGSIGRSRQIAGLFRQCHQGRKPGKHRWKRWLTCGSNACKPHPASLCPAVLAHSSATLYAGDDRDWGPGRMGVLAGKVVLVTGAGRGIGREVAVLAAREGAQVVVNDLGGDVGGAGVDATPAQETTGLIEAAGGEAVVNGDSVADYQAAGRMVSQAVEVFGRLDGVVNVAGILRDVIFHKMTEADWDAVISVHLKGSFNVARHAADRFRAQESGAMVHFTSTSGLIGNFGQANYAAAKMGIVGLSKSIALDMQRFNVRSNCMSPFAWTRMIGTIPSNTPEQQARLEKIKQMTPAQIAPMVVYLLSDLASDVTGQIFGSRMNEQILFSQNRPVRSVHRSEGWTPTGIHEHAMPALKAAFSPLDRDGDVFYWDPV